MRNGASGPLEKGDPVKVLYIAGWGRSGSTILGRVLGEVEGFTWIGELRYILSRGVSENRVCSCGESFDSCPFWSRVSERVLGGTDQREIEELIRLREQGPRVRHVAFSPGESLLESRVARMGRYLDTLRGFYEAAREVSGARVLVDTSKFPSDAYILKKTPGIEVYLLHLVRDPRAVGYSWSSRRKLKRDHKGGPQKQMTRHGVAESALLWSEWNHATERIFKDAPERYMLLRYEDFVGSPRATVNRVLGFMGEGNLDSPFEGESTLSLDTPHAFSGNPDRFSSGMVEIKPNEEWKTRISKAQQATTVALTLPGMLRYGYLSGRNVSR